MFHSKPVSKKMPKQLIENKKEPNYEQIGRAMVNVLEFGYADKKRLFKMSLLRGIATGLGSVIGATIVVALMLWILSLVDFVPLIDEIENTLQDQMR